MGRGSVALVSVLLTLASCLFLTPADREAHLCAGGLADTTFGDADRDGIADCLDAEECDGVDNDGDGSADEALHPDADGDGYGGEAEEGPCFYGWVPEPGDCDDTDPRVSPGASFELADGKNTTCVEEWTGDVDVATMFIRDDQNALGEPEDVTDLLAAGGPFELPANAVLYVAPASSGAWPVAITTAANAESVEIYGVPLDGACDPEDAGNLPTFSGLDGSPRLTLAASDALTATIDCIGIVGGRSIDAEGVRIGADTEARISRSAIYGNLGPAVGGIWNLGELTLEDVVVRSNSVGSKPADEETAGGIRSEGRLTMIGGRITGNYAADYGGGLGVLAGSAHLYGVVIGGTADEDKNHALRGGGGLSVAPGGQVHMQGAVVDGNSTEGFGGGVRMYGTLDCVQSDGVGAITDNRSRNEPGGIHLLGGAILNSQGCVYTGNVHNPPYDSDDTDIPSDIYIAESGQSVMVTDACFVCTSTGCASVACS